MTEGLFSQFGRHLALMMPRAVQFLVAITTLLGPLSLVETYASDRHPTTWLTGVKLRDELDQTFSVNMTRSDLRRTLKQVATDRHVSIVLDRRLDPSTEFPVDVKQVSLRTGLAQIVSDANGDAVLTENTVFLGPKSATTRLRTLIELRKIEIPERRRTELQRHRTIKWSDLDAPRDILEMIAKPFGMTVLNSQMIPHDLWASATLPDVSLTEALSIVLIQFDLTYRWADSGASIELISIPEKISLERKFRPKLKPADAIELIRSNFPNIEARVSHSDVVITGLIEDFEAATNLLRGDTPTRPRRASLTNDLRKQKFTFRLEYPASISAVIKGLEKEDLHFEYDAAELKAAGIDLEKMIEIDVKGVSAEEFFKAIFDPVHIEFQIDRSTVKLSSKKDKQTK